jgi:hypothetical protein
VRVFPLTRKFASEAKASDSERQAALAMLSEAWDEARIEGIDGDCLAQVALFRAFNELVSTYGEEATARYADGLGERIRRGEFTVAPKQ